MKSIYINLDPYLQAVADWLNAGKPGTEPSFQPLPVAVTIPLGEDVCIFGPGDEDHIGLSFSVDGKEILVCSNDDGGPAFPTVPMGETLIGTTTEKFSAYATKEDYSTVSVYSVSGNKVEFPLYFYEDDVLVATIPFTVLVRRETASGPVDLVDFTPPAAPSAADIKSALVAAGDGALAGVKLDGAVLVTMEDGMQPSEATQIGESGPLVKGTDLETQLGVGSASA